jgi:Ca2+ transporting ATPase
LGDHRRRDDQVLQIEQEVGLTAAQVQENTKYGLNVFPVPPGKSIFEMITDQFKDQMIQVPLFTVVLGFVFVFFEQDQ